MLYETVIFYGEEESMKSCMTGLTVSHSVQLSRKWRETETTVETTRTRGDR